MSSNDIIFVLSGGQNANDPMNSIGGLPSIVEVKDNINNLFPNITTQQLQQNVIDHRCFYVINKNSSESLIDITVWIKKNQSKGSNVQLGLALQNEIQLLTIPNDPTSGSIHFVSRQPVRDEIIVERTPDLLWVRDAAVMANKMEAALNSLTMLNGIKVNGMLNATTWTFFINFTGFTGNHKRVLLESKSNFHSEITPLVFGSPINTIAPNIGVSNNLPTGVTFSDAERGHAIKIGTLEPEDVMPIWIQRTISPGTQPIHPDRFIFHLTGTTVPAINLHRHQKKGI